MLKNPPYTYIKEGYYYFSRNVPLDLIHYYRKSRVVQALRTQSFAHAKAASSSFLRKWPFSFSDAYKANAKVKLE